MLNSPIRYVLGRKLRQTFTPRRQTDYSNYFDYTVRDIVTPQSAEDAAATIRQLNAAGQTWKIKSAGMSFHANTIGSGITQLLNPIDTTPSFTMHDGYITTRSNSELWSLDRALWAAGYQLPIAPTLRGSSLGGVLSVGGISAESASKGILAQFVKRMTVITETGEQMSCSADQDSEQFYRTLCGAGQAGLIWDVDIAIEPKPATHAIFRNMEPLPLERLDGILDFFLKRDDNLPEGCILRLDKTAQQIENIYLIYNSSQPKAERQNILIGTDIIPLDRKVPNFRAQDDVEYYGRDDFFMIPCVVYTGRSNLTRIIELAQDAAGFMAAHDLDYYQNIDVVKSAPLDRSRPHWPNHNDEPFTTSLELVAMVHKSQRALADQLHDKLLAFTRAAAAYGGRPYRTTWHDEAIYDTPAKTA